MRKINNQSQKSTQKLLPFDESEYSEYHGDLVTDDEGFDKFLEDEGY